MSKLATFAALFLVALVALTEATTYTTITTTTIDETNSKSCQEQIRGQQMSHCMMYLKCQGGSRYESLRRAVVNPRCEEQHKEQCCNQLGNISKECRCQAIKKMVMEQGSEKMQEMMQMARDLPNQCNMKPQHCEMRAVWF